MLHNTSRLNKLSTIGVEETALLRFTARAMAVIFCLITAACSTNPHQAKQIETQMQNAGQVSGSEIVGLKSGEMVVLNKTEMAEKMRDLQNGVFSLEDKVYGNRKLGSLGLYGELKSCKRKLASRQFGGNGTLMWSEPLDRLTDKEEEIKVGLDEQGQLVGITEEKLKDRIQRFQSYNLILKKRQDDFESQISTCKSELSGKEMDPDQPSRVLVQETPKSSIDRTSINQFMCSYVKEGASFQMFLLNAFAKSWLSLSDFSLDQNLLAASLKDATGKSRDNAILFSGWKLAYDKGDISAGQLLNEGKDAKLVAWAYDKKADLESGQKCLTRADGEWNR